ncbi:MAG: hypothetical protein JW797_16295 [Bradymonadales bacterium]|nr:hypothetical protein [Bradymonadales bacterium]
MASNSTSHRVAFSIACGLVLTAIGCQFDSNILEQRRCTEHHECTGGYRCIDNICQGIPPDWDGGGPDLTEVEEIDPCHDYDDDGFFAGTGCTQTPADCNDFDPDVHPGTNEILAAPEICDGKDNDCDGLTDTDDSEDYQPTECPLTLGVCAGSVRVCTDGVPQDCPLSAYGQHYVAVEENDQGDWCDNRDNDCDGLTDESITVTCYTGEEGTIREGAPCAAGYRVCEGDDDWSDECYDEILPEDEDTYDHRCDGVDNNCDGTIDEACVCNPGDTRPCYPPTDQTTADHPPCHRGVQTCGDDWRWGDCIGWAGPGTETCENIGIDDNCNGSIALSEIEDWGDACTDSGLLGECMPGTLLCVEDGGGDLVLGCVQNKYPEAETCANRGLDNDCDGDATDADIPGFGGDCWIEQFEGNPVYGECRYGTTECSTATPSALICRPSSVGIEVCDLLDNDCDDAIDNGVDTDFDEDHCGACFAACQDGETCCDGQCVDTSSDITYCGASGENLCGLDCDDSNRSDPACCDGVCADLDYDEAYCGTCGDSCNMGETCCSGDCFNLETEEAHCGTCDHSCSAGSEQCCDSACVPKDDPDNCGGCDVVCSATQSCCDDSSGGYACQDWTVDNCGQCGLECEAGWSCCGGVCKDISSDIYFCGDCDTDCTDDTLTDPACCGSACVDLDNDRANCGSCGNNCGDLGSSYYCIEGACVDISSSNSYCGTAPDALSDCTTSGPSYACCSGNCVDLASGMLDGLQITHCGMCSTTCPADTSTQIWDCCAGFCVDTQSDLDHCGACTGGDVVCAPDQGELCCGGSCVDATGNAGHCGACGYDCQVEEGLMYCVNGECSDSP